VEVTRRAALCSPATSTRSAKGWATFAALRDVPMGARLIVTDVFGGRHGYSVQARRSYGKYGRPTDCLPVAGAGRLVLITAAGRLIGGSGSTATTSWCTPSRPSLSCSRCTNACDSTVCRGPSARC
jgi:hypothetical protein